MQRKKLIVLFAVLIAIVIALFIYLSADREQKVVGKVLELTGLVEAQKANTPSLVKVFPSMAFTEGDTIFTRADGKVNLQIDTTKKVYISPDTEVVFTELVSSMNAKGGQSYLNLYNGKVMIDIDETLDGESKFQIETPNAIMGVMGTQFIVSYDGIGTWVIVLEGAVQVERDGEIVTLVPNDKRVYITNTGDVTLQNIDPAQLQEMIDYFLLQEDDPAMLEIAKWLTALQQDNDSSTSEPDEGDEAGLVDEDDETGVITIGNNTPPSDGTPAPNTPSPTDPSSPASNGQGNTDFTDATDDNEDVDNTSSPDTDGATGQEQTAISTARLQQLLDSARQLVPLVEGEMYASIVQAVTAAEQVVASPLTEAQVNGAYDTLKQVLDNAVQQMTEQIEQARRLLAQLMTVVRESEPDVLQQPTLIRALNEAELTYYDAQATRTMIQSMHSTLEQAHAEALEETARIRVRQTITQLLQQVEAYVLTGQPDVTAVLPQAVTIEGELMTAPLAQLQAIEQQLQDALQEAAAITARVYEAREMLQQHIDAAQQFLAGTVFGEVTSLQQVYVEAQQMVANVTASLQQLNDQAAQLQSKQQTLALEQPAFIAMRNELDALMVESDYYVSNEATVGIVQPAYRAATAAMTDARTPYATLQATSSALRQAIANARELLVMQAQSLQDARDRLADALTAAQLYALNPVTATFIQAAYASAQAVYEQSSATVALLDDQTAQLNEAIEAAKAMLATYEQQLAEAKAELAVTIQSAAPYMTNAIVINIIEPAYHAALAVQQNEAATLVAINEAIAALVAATEEAQAAVMAYEQALAEAKEKLFALLAEASEYAANELTAGTMTVAYESARLVYAKAEATVAEVNEAIEKLTEAITEAKAEVAAYEQALAEAKEELFALLAEASEYAANELTAGTMTVAYENAQQVYAKAEATVAEVTEAIEKLTEAITEAKAEVEAYEQALAEAKEELFVLLEEASEYANNELTAEIMAVAYENAQQVYAKAEATVAEVKEAIEKLTEAITEAKAEVAAYEQALAEAKEELFALLAEAAPYATNELTVETIVTAYENAVTVQAAASSSLVEVKEAIEILASALAEAKAQLEAYEQALAEAKYKLFALMEEASPYAANDLTAEITAAAYENAQRIYTKAEATVAEVTEAIEKLTEAITEAKAEVAAYEQALAEAKLQLSSLLQEAMSYATNAVTAETMATAYAMAQQVAAYSEASLVEVKAAVTELTNALAEAKEQLETYARELAVAKNRLATLLEEASSYVSNKVTAESIKAAYEQATALQINVEATLVEVNEAVERLTLALAKAKEQLAVYEQELAAAKGILKALLEQAEPYVSNELTTEILTFIYESGLVIQANEASTLAEINASIAELRTAIEKAQEQLVAYERELAEAKAGLAALLEEAALYVSNVLTQQLMTEAYEKGLLVQANMSASVNEVREVMEALTTVLAEAQSIVEAYERELAEAKQQLLSLSQEATPYASNALTVEIITPAIEVARQVERNNKATLTEVTEAIEKLSQALAEAKAEVEAYEQALAEAKQELFALLEEASPYAANELTAEIIEAAYENAQQVYTKAEATLAEVTEAIENLSQALAEAKAEVEAYEQALAEAKQELFALLEEASPYAANELTAEIMSAAYENAQQVYTKAEATLAEVTEATEKLSQALAEAKAEVEAYEQALAEAKQELFALLEEASPYAANELTAEIIEAAYENAQQVYTKAEATLAEVTEAIEKLSQVLAEAKAEVEAYEQALAEAKQELFALMDETSPYVANELTAEMVETVYENAQQVYTKAEATLAEVTEAIEKLEQALIEAKAEVAAYEQALAEAKQELFTLLEEASLYAGNELTVEIMSAAYENAQQVYAKAEVTVAEVIEAVEKLSQALAEAKAEVEAYEQALAEAKQELSALLEEASEYVVNELTAQTMKTSYEAAVNLQANETATLTEVNENIATLTAALVEAKALLEVYGEQLAEAKAELLERIEQASYYATNELTQSIVSSLYETALLVYEQEDVALADVQVINEQLYAAIVEAEAAILAFERQLAEAKAHLSALLVQAAPYVELEVTRAILVVAYEEAKETSEQEDASLQQIEAATTALTATLAEATALYEELLAQARAALTAEISVTEMYMANPLTAPIVTAYYSEALAVRHNLEASLQVIETITTTLREANMQAEQLVIVRDEAKQQLILMIEEAASYMSDPVAAPLLEASFLEAQRVRDEEEASIEKIEQATAALFTAVEQAKQQVELQAQELLAARQQLGLLIEEASSYAEHPVTTALLADVYREALASRDELAATREQLVLAYEALNARLTEAKERLAAYNEALETARQQLSQAIVELSPYVNNERTAHVVTNVYEQARVMQDQATATLDELEALLIRLQQALEDALAIEAQYTEQLAQAKSDLARLLDEATPYVVHHVTATRMIDTYETAQLIHANTLALLNEVTSAAEALQLAIAEAEALLEIYEQQVEEAKTELARLLEEAARFVASDVTASVIEPSYEAALAVHINEAAELLNITSASSALQTALEEAQAIQAAYEQQIADARLILNDVIEEAASYVANELTNETVLESYEKATVVQLDEAATLLDVTNATAALQNSLVEAKQLLEQYVEQLDAAKATLAMLLEEAAPYATHTLTAAEMTPSYEAALATHMNEQATLQDVINVTTALEQALEEAMAIVLQYTSQLNEARERLTERLQEAEDYMTDERTASTVQAIVEDAQAILQNEQATLAQVIQATEALEQMIQEAAAIIEAYEQTLSEARARLAQLLEQATTYVAFAVTAPIISELYEEGVALQANSEAALTVIQAMNELLDEALQQASDTLADYESELAEQYLRLASLLAEAAQYRENELTATIIAAAYEQAVLVQQNGDALLADVQQAATQLTASIAEAEAAIAAYEAELLQAKEQLARLLNEAHIYVQNELTAATIATAYEAAEQLRNNENASLEQVLATNSTLSFAINEAAAIIEADRQQRVAARAYLQELLDEATTYVNELLTASTIAPAYDAAQEVMQNEAATLLQLQLATEQLQTAIAEAIALIEQDAQQRTAARDRLNELLVEAAPYVTHVLTQHLLQTTYEQMQQLAVDELASLATLQEANDVLYRLVAQAETVVNEATAGAREQLIVHLQEALPYYEAAVTKSMIALQYEEAMQLVQQSATYEQLQASMTQLQQAIEQAGAYSEEIEAIRFTIDNLLQQLASYEQHDITSAFVQPIYAEASELYANEQTTLEQLQQLQRTLTSTLAEAEQRILQAERRITLEQLQQQAEPMLRYVQVAITLQPLNEQASMLLAEDDAAVEQLEQLIATFEQALTSIAPLYDALHALAEQQQQAEQLLAIADTYIEQQLQQVNEQAVEQLQAQDGVVEQLEQLTSALQAAVHDVTAYVLAQMEQQLAQAEPLAAGEAALQAAIEQANGITVTSSVNSIVQAYTQLTNELMQVLVRQERAALAASLLQLAKYLDVPQTTSAVTAVYTEAQQLYNDDTATLEALRLMNANFAPLILQVDPVYEAYKQLEQALLASEVWKNVSYDGIAQHAMSVYAEYEALLTDVQATQQQLEQATANLATDEANYRIELYEQLQMQIEKSYRYEALQSLRQEAQLIDEQATTSELIAAYEAIATALEQMERDAAVTELAQLLTDAEMYRATVRTSVIVEQSYIAAQQYIADDSTTVFMLQQAYDALAEVMEEAAPYLAAYEAWYNAMQDVSVLMQVEYIDVQQLLVPLNAQYESYYTSTTTMIEQYEQATVLLKDAVQRASEDSWHDIMYRAEWSMGYESEALASLRQVIEDGIPATYIELAQLHEQLMSAIRVVLRDELLQFMTQIEALPEDLRLQLQDDYSEASRLYADTSATLQELEEISWRLQQRLYEVVGV